MDISQETIEEFAEALEVNSLDEKLLALQRVIEPMVKDKPNPFYNSKYFDINQLLEAVTPQLNAMDIRISQPLRGDKVYTIIKDVPTGLYEESWLNIPPNLDAQKLGAAVTFLRRYTLLSVLGIQAEDDDGNGAVAKPEVARQNMIAAPAVPDATYYPPKTNYTKKIEDIQERDGVQTKCSDCGGVLRMKKDGSKMICGEYCWTDEHRWKRDKYRESLQKGPSALAPKIEEASPPVEREVFPF